MFIEYFQTRRQGSSLRILELERSFSERDQSSRNAERMDRIDHSKVVRLFRSRWAHPPFHDWISARVSQVLWEMLADISRTADEASQGFNCRKQTDQVKNNFPVGTQHFFSIARHFDNLTFSFSGSTETVDKCKCRAYHMFQKTLWRFQQRKTSCARFLKSKVNINRTRKKHICLKEWQNLMSTRSISRTFRPLDLTDSRLANHTGTRSGDDTSSGSSVRRFASSQSAKYARPQSFTSKSPRPKWEVCERKSLSQISSVWFD